MFHYWLNLKLQLFDVFVASGKIHGDNHQQYIADVPKPLSEQEMRLCSKAQFYDSRQTVFATE